MKVTQLTQLRFERYQSAHKLFLNICGVSGIIADNALKLLTAYFFQQNHLLLCFVLMRVSQILVVFIRNESHTTGLACSILASVTILQH